MKDLTRKEKRRNRYEHKHWYTFTHTNENVPIHLHFCNNVEKYVIHHTLWNAGRFIGVYGVFWNVEEIREKNGTALKHEK